MWLKKLDYERAKGVAESKVENDKNEEAGFLKEMSPKA